MKTKKLMALMTSDQPIHWIVQGDGPPVILLHGIGASSLGWSALIPDLVRAGYQIYAPDLPGHGESYKPQQPESYHVRNISQALVDWIRSLALPSLPILIGHSLGGYLSLQFSLDYPERLRALVLVNPFYTPGQLFPIVRWLRGRADAGSRALERISAPLLERASEWNPTVSKQLSREFRRQMAADLFRASPLILNILPSVRDLTPRLAEVATPAGVIWGSRDLTLSPASFPALIDRLPNAVGYHIPGGRHQPHMSRPEMVNAYILTFLGGV